MYRLESGQAVAATVDFFTPLVDDPEQFGAVAAANSLSDLYAMNVTPAFALAVLSIPAGEFPDEVVEAIYRGASEVCREAGIVIAGGHSVDDPEPKFGLVAVGLGDPERLYRKRGGEPGDALVLGKGLGTGVITTAIKAQEARPEEIRAAVRSMRQLNRDAAAVLEEFRVHAATDVTGFGLLGHLWELCRAGGHGARVDADAPLLIEGAARLAAAGHVPGGTRRNRSAVEQHLGWGAGVPEERRILLCDAQTSGGLLAAVPRDQADDVVRRWTDRGYAAARVGDVVEAGDGPPIRVDGGAGSGTGTRS